MVLILRACKVFRKCPRVSNSQSQPPLSRLASSPSHGYLPLPRGVHSPQECHTIKDTSLAATRLWTTVSHSSSLPTILCKLHTYM